jgi:hypothetical protein
MRMKNNLLAILALIVISVTLTVYSPKSYAGWDFCPEINATSKTAGIFTDLFDNSLASRVVLLSLSMLPLVLSLRWLGGQVRKNRKQHRKNLALNQNVFIAITFFIIFGYAFAISFIFIAKKVFFTPVWTDTDVSSIFASCTIKTYTLHPFARVLLVILLVCYLLALIFSFADQVQKTKKAILH